MRTGALVILGPLLALCGLCGCTATVGNIEPGERTDGDAFLAGVLSFQGSRISAKMQWRADDGKHISVRTGAGAFLVAVPPGRYELRKFGAYRVTDDTITFHAVAGETRYLGTFEAARDQNGELRVVVRDRRAAVQKKLRATYDGLTLTAGLVESALVPLQKNSGDLVIAVEPPEPPRFYYSVGFGHHSHFYGHRRHRRSRARTR